MNKVERLFMELLLFRACMRRMAYTAGAHFFKCPLCNNRDEFTEEMLQFGIYIPEQVFYKFGSGAAGHGKMLLESIIIYTEIEIKR